jgi:hypothetical protein
MKNIPLAADKTFTYELQNQSKVSVEGKFSYYSKLHELAQLIKSQTQQKLNETSSRLILKSIRRVIEQNIFVKNASIDKTNVYNSIQNLIPIVLKMASTKITIDNLEEVKLKSMELFEIAYKHNQELRWWRFAMIQKRKQKSLFRKLIDPKFFYIFQCFTL